MLEKRTPLQINQAVEKIMDHAIEGKTEVVSISESDQRFLGEDILASHDVPLFTRSGFDGYALRSVDSMDASSDQPIEFTDLSGCVHKGSEVTYIILQYKMSYQKPPIGWIKPYKVYLCRVFDHLI